MKIIEVNELKNKNQEVPFYSIVDPSKLGTADPRACGCATLALLNMILSLKKRLKIDDRQTAFDEMKWIQEQTNENENSTSPEVLMGFIDKHPIFNSCRMLVMNPNGMDEEVFLRIFLRRLAEGNLALAMMEVPDHAGEPAKDSINHISFVHVENGEVCFDGLPVDLNFLLRALYFSRPTTLMFLRSILEETMDDRSEPLPWDYFLTNYERDLLILEIDEVILKYPLVNLEQIQADVLEIRQSFGRGNVNADF